MASLCRADSQGVSLKILIWGSGGFLGRHFREALGQLEGVVLLAPPRSQVELSNEKAVFEATKTFHPDLVINCAVKVSDLGQSIKASMNVIRSLPEKSLYFQVGSGAEYSRLECPENAAENDFGLRIPNDDYGIFKFLTAQTLDTVIPNRFLNLRTFGVFGVGEESRRIIPSLVTGALNAKRAQLSQDASFSYVSVNDLVDFLLGWISRGLYLRGHYNFCGDTPIRLSDVLTLVSQKVPNAIYLIENRQNNGSPYYGSSRLLTESAPWFRFRSLHKEISDYIDALLISSSKAES